MKRIIKDLKKNEIIRKSLVVLIIRIVGAILFFGLTIYITNNFPPSLVGEYDFSRSSLILLGGLCSLGMTDSIIYYSGFLIANNGLSSLKKVYLKMLVIMFSMAIILIIIFFIIGKSLIIDFFGNDKSYEIILKTIVITFFYSLTMLNVEVFRAIKRIKTSELFRNVFRFCFFLIFLTILYFKNINNYLLDSFLLNFVIVALISTPIVYKILSNLEKENHIEINVKSIILRSYPMSFSVISLLIMQSVDIILIGKFHEFDKIAIYSVAVKITTIIALVLASVNAVIAPKISELFNLGHFKKLSSLLKNTTRIIFILTFPVIFFLYIGCKYILGFFGESYVEAESSLKILLLGQSINMLCGSVGTYMNMTGKQKFFQNILILACIINIILNMSLIPEYGIRGAAISTSISMALWNIIAVVFLYYKDKVATFLH